MSRGSGQWSVVGGQSHARVRRSDGGSVGLEDTWWWGSKRCCDLDQRGRGGGHPFNAGKQESFWPRSSRRTAA